MSLSFPWLNGVQGLFVCFVFKNSIVNEILFLISFPLCLFLVYRKATEFYLLVLYPTTLLNVCSSVPLGYLPEVTGKTHMKIKHMEKSNWLLHPYYLETTVDRRHAH
jgi:hypothetical protein